MKVLVCGCSPPRGRFVRARLVAIARRRWIHLAPAPDPLRTRDIDDMIQQTQERFDLTSIVISHDMASTFRVAHMIAMLYQGNIVAYGAPAELRGSRDRNVQQFIHAGSVEVH